MENQKPFASDSQLSFFTPDAKMIRISLDEPVGINVTNHLMENSIRTDGRLLQKGA